MSHDYERHHDIASTSASPTADLAAVSKISRSAQLRRPASPQPSGFLQLRGASQTGAVDQTTSDIEERAAVGVSSGGGAVPHATKMEAAFGTSFAGVKAHTDAGAQAACDSIGAQAYATGNSIAFKEANPSEALVAHELTHVLQQRGGMQAKGVGESASLEAEADSVGSRVAAGESVVDITAKYAGATPGASAVQRKKQSTTEGATQQDEVVATGQTQPDDVAGFAGGSVPVEQQTAAAVGATTGADVSGARVHDNPAANQLAASLGTRAVAAGGDIAVAKGENINQPGNKVLAHELAHVAQSGGASGSNTTFGGTPGPAAAEVGASNAAEEVEADIIAERAVAATLNKGAKAAVESGPRAVPDLPAEKLAPLELDHLKTNQGRRVLRGWNTHQVLDETLDLFPSNLIVKMKNPPNIVGSLYTGGWEPEVYFNHEWSIGGSGRFTLGGVQHASWDDGNSWTKLAGVPLGKLAMPTDDYAGAKIRAEASMTRRPDFHWNERTVQVGAPVYTFKNAFETAPRASAEGLGFDAANRTPIGSRDLLAASQIDRVYTLSYTQTVSKSVSDSATSTYGHTTQYADETSVGLKAAGTLGEDKSGKLGVEGTFGKKWTETETDAAQRAMGSVYTDLTQKADTLTVPFPVPAGVPAAVLVVPTTKKVTSTFVMRGVAEGGLILGNDMPTHTKVLNAQVPKGLTAFYGYDLKYATALENHYNECLEIYRIGNLLPVGKARDDKKRQLQQKIDKFSKENQPDFGRAIAHAEELLKASSPSAGTNTVNPSLVSGDNMQRYHKKLNELYTWATL
ncbi:MAG: DUF4157 domain-containing protein [Deltaproteobacteria bacterium]|nr:DUF4157 domain-containing protein [Deltaproteobacteria bacterium]